MKEAKPFHAHIDEWFRKFMEESILNLLEEQVNHSIFLTTNTEIELQAGVSLYQKSA